jgi:parallel beta-helix repeat protein
MRSCSWLFAASSLLLLASPAHAKNIVVKAGDSIQAAVDAASPGDTIRVMPGTYHETGSPCPSDPSHTCAVVITKAGISLVGVSKHHGNPGSHGNSDKHGKHGKSDGGDVVLENPGGQDQGIAIAPPNVTPATCRNDQSQRLAGASVTGFTVNGFDGEGIFLLCVDQFAVRFNEANDNVEYGIFPSHSTRGTISFNVATGSNDTGIYIGQSDDIRVDHNLATGNVSGFEIENASNVRLDHNVATGNTGGILSFTLPFLDVKANTSNRVDHNWVQGNNKPNSCVDLSDAVCGVPPGTGILLLAVDANEVDHNIVLGNDSYGIAVANFCLAQNLTPEQCTAISADIEPNPDNNEVDHNIALNNGGHPSDLINPVFAKDLAWDTSGTGNCWAKNKAGTQFPDTLPACQ